MKMKRIPALLCGAALVLTAAGCSGSAGGSKATPDPSVSKSEPVKVDVEKMHKLNIRSSKELGKITATFTNTSNGKTKDVKMKKSGSDDNDIVYCCEADVNKYNMVHVTFGETTSMDVTFNSFISGWNIKDDELLPYVVGTEPVYNPKFDKKVFEFDGRYKKVYIWKPADYDEKSEEKYSVIYMFDGQSVLTTGKDKGMDNDEVSWNVSEHVTSMMEVTDNKSIIVAVDNNDVYRTDELVPDLGEINMENEPANAKAEDLSKKRGSAFADFLCDTVMPYINENFNVYTDAQHTALAGASLGGLETFYTVLSHPDKFGTGGVMSATFDMYAKKEWKEFLNDKLKSENAPFLYFYAGGYKTDNGDVTETMYNYLVKNGYSKNKLVFNKYESGEHMIEYWRSIYPEFLEAVFTQKVSALEGGVSVHYKDKTDPLDKYLEDYELDINDIEPGYVYYDNSETKWDKVYAYWWGGMAFNSFTKEPYYFSEWPGYEMEQLEGTDIYRVVAPWGCTGIIFDSGVTDREVAEGKDAFQTTDIQYNNDLIGKMYKIDTSVKPKADSGIMKSKRRYSKGSWSDYSAE